MGHQTENNTRFEKIKKHLISRRFLFSLGGGIAALLGAKQAMAQVPHIFSNGQVADASQVNENFDTLYHFFPIGAVVPWHKNPKDNNDTSMPSPTLSSAWVECNGQILVDAESPLDGMKVPDLNGATDEFSGKGLFVRGGAVSGNYQEDQMQSHKHDDSGHSHSGWVHGGGHYVYGHEHHNHWEANLHGVGTGHANLGDPTETGAGAPRHGEETRPVNMSMVYIMRVK